MDKNTRILIIIQNHIFHSPTQFHAYSILLKDNYKKELDNIAEKYPSLKFYDDWSDIVPFSIALKNDLKYCIRNGLIHEAKINFLKNKYEISKKGKYLLNEIKQNCGEDIHMINEMIDEITRKTFFDKVLEYMSPCEDIDMNKFGGVLEHLYFSDKYSYFKKLEKHLEANSNKI